MKQPTTYHQWREKWRETLCGIGYCCLDAKREDRCTRTLWRLRHRAARIKKRLDAEASAFTASYAKAVAEMVFRKARP